MQFDLASLLAAARDSVQNPRDGARRVLNMNLSLGDAALALLIVAILTALLTAIVSIIGQTAGASGQMMSLSPLNWVIVQVAGLFLGAGAIHAVGRWFGGTGTLPGAVAVLAWSQFILLIVQVVQVAALFVLPPISVLLALAGVGLTFWLLVNFVAELHGFSSLIKVFFGILGTSIALVVLASMVLAALFGVAGVPNV